MSPQIACLQECWLLLHIFLGHQGRWLIDHVEEEGEPINSKEMLGGGQSFWTRNFCLCLRKNLLQWILILKKKPVTRNLSSVTNVTATQI